MNKHGIDFEKLYSFDKTAGDLLVSMLGTADRIDQTEIGNLHVYEGANGKLQEVKNMLPAFSESIAKTINNINPNNSAVEIGKLKLALINIQDVFAKMGFNTVSAVRNNVGKAMQESIKFDPNELELGALTDKLKSIILTIEMNFKD